MLYDISQVHLKALRAQIEKQLLRSGISQDCLKQSQINLLFEDSSQYANPFSEVATPHRQLNFIRTHLDFVVMLYSTTIYTSIN